MSKRVYQRLGLTDVLIPINTKLESKYIQVKDEDGFTIDESELSHICWEDETGEECNEDGSEL